MPAKPKHVISDDQLRQLETMAGLGLKITQMAAILGMSKATFDRRMQDTPGAYEALEKGRSQAALAVTKTAFQLATSGKVPSMTMFWLKCRQNWSEMGIADELGDDDREHQERMRELKQRVDEIKRDLLGQD